MIFLINHPAWSWADLDSAPEDVVAMLGIADEARATESRRPKA